MQSQSISRRAFLRRGALGAAALALPAAFRAYAGQGAQSGRTPNVLLIITDQQRADMLSCAGNRYLKTPAMDSIAANGARFERAYCAHPLCVPSRFSMMTGLMPSLMKQMTKRNDKKEVPGGRFEGALGWLFRDAGYETAYGGKVHVPMSLDQIGFDCISTDMKDELAGASAAFLRRKHDRPFLLVASFINPHDICYMAIRAYGKANPTKSIRQRGEKPAKTPREKPAPSDDEEEPADKRPRDFSLPEGVSREDFYAKMAPSLPDNYAIPPDEPEVVRLEDPREFRFWVREHWTDEDWRLHRWHYARLTESVDVEIGAVLRALREGGLEESTVVVFTSDHGDMDASHRLEHKSILYEEAMRVPFLVSWKGVTKPGLVDDDHLVSTGLDLIPTLCDFAGIRPPKDRAGRSVRPLAEGRAPEAWRDSLVIEGRHSRAIRTERFKYTLYDSGERREALVDLRDDPSERRNLTQDPNYSSVLESLRASLREAMEKSGDPSADQFTIR